MTFVGYHCTSTKNAKSIINDGPLINTDSERLPNDLGVGMYFFLDNDIYSKKGLEMAESFAKVYRNSDRSSKSVLKLTFSNEGSYLDLNDNSQVKIFDKFRNENFADVLSYYNELCEKSMRNKGELSPILRRANLDGVLLEMLRKHTGINGVIKDTYTPQDKKYNKSNFPNGREFCLYDTELIVDKKIIKEF